MAINKETLRSLSSLIIENIKADFSQHKLSGNLVNTIETEEDENGIKITIPARAYNMLIYQTTGAIVYTSHGSYASKLDIEGSSFYVYPYGSRKGSFKIYPRNHIGFVNRVIDQSLDEYLQGLSSRYEVVSKTELET